MHFFQLWSFENYTSKFIPHLGHKISCSFSPSPSTHLLLPSSSYPWLPMVVSLFLTHFLLEVASPIIFLPSPFRCHSSSRSKWLHWWRRSKAYKLHMELHHRVPTGDDPSYWLDACEDTSYDDFIDFDVSSIVVSDQPDKPSLPCVVRIGQRWMNF